MGGADGVGGVDGALGVGGETIVAVEARVDGSDGVRGVYAWPVGNRRVYGGDGGGECA